MRESTNTTSHLFQRFCQHSGSISLKSGSHKSKIMRQHKHGWISKPPLCAETLMEKMKAMVTNALLRMWG